MASVEDRIVKIQFDNASFERKLASTIASIQKLNTTLANTGSKSGLDTISNSAKNFNLHGVGASIEGISAKFLALGTIAVTVLSNITTKALTAAAQIAKAFTLDPLIGGFKEYELQIGSIQTILANTSADGTNLQQVNAALDELNTYSDKTIYNFGEMTRNIGTFTAAGVDLDLSVQSIKGIANLAAISGSSSEQASTAMYQLSQAMASGTVRLMDWNSVVNAGMGGEVFQKALFETGKTMGTIADVPIDQTFEEWTAAGNTFRGSLEEGWLTADVLTTTLQGFTGEMTEAEIMAQGFTQTQAQEIMRLGALGVDAATKVRTFTQLISTAKEAISSGWAQSFRTIFGDFEEATSLFTGISDAIGGFISRQADARNTMLKSWADMGGRTRLIWSFGSAFKSLGIIMAPIREAFRQVFPKTTALDLFNLTRAFQKFTSQTMRPSAETVGHLKRVFSGFFSALKIGWTILKEGTKFVVNLVKSLTGLGSGGLLKFLAEVGDIFTKLKRNLVDGEGIANFFDDLTISLQKPVEFISRLRKAFFGLFDGLKIPSGLGDFFGSLGGMFGGLGEAGADAASSAGGIWEPLKSALSGVGDILDGAWDTLSGWFSGLGDMLSDVFSAPDFDSVLEVLDTALLGGIAALIYKFTQGGMFDNFGGGIFKNISSAFGELTGTLQAMQTDLKASALLKIAIAIGILAVSLLLLSTIDPEKLGDAMAALALTFGQLMGAFALLNKMSINLTGAATLVLIAGGMVIMAGAVLILVGAIKLLSMLSWEELAKGLAGVAGSLGLLTGAAIALSFAKGSMISSGIGMLFIAAALVIMAGAVKLFSMMEWDEMIKGLVGVAGALVAVGIGMALMPKGILLQGAGLILVAAALNIIAVAMKQMAQLGWEEIGKGLVTIAGALAGIAATTYFMGPLLPLVGIGLILVAVSLKMIAGVMKELATMSWEDIGKGLAGMAGALIAIGAAMAIASSGALGAVGIIGVAFALTILIGVMKALAEMSWGEIIKGVGGIAIVLGVLGVAALLLAPAVGPLLGFAAAILLLGAGFALFGLGITAIAKGLKALVKLGDAAGEAIITLFEAIGTALPQLFKDISESVLEFLDTLLAGMPEIIDKLVEVLGSILDGLVELLPKAGEVIRKLLDEVIRIITEYYPQIVEMGFGMIMALLTGLRDNIGPITEAVAQILINFMDALALQVPALIDSFYNLLLAVIEGVVSKLVDLGQLLLPKGMELLRGLLEGAKQLLPVIGAWFLSLPGKIKGFLGDAIGWLLNKGKDVINGLYNGAIAAWNGIKGWFAGIPDALKKFIPAALDVLKNIGSNVINGLYNGAIAAWNGIKGWFAGLPAALKKFIPDALNLLKNIGSAVIKGLYNGAIAAWNAVKGWFAGIPAALKKFIPDALNLLKNIGSAVIKGLYNGAIAAWNTIKGWFAGIPSALKAFIPDAINILKTIGKNVINGLYNGAIAAWNTIKGWFGGIAQGIRTAIGGLRDLLTDIGGNIMNSLKNGAANVFETVKQWFLDKAIAIRDAVLNFFGIGSPSKVFQHIGEYVMLGLLIGMENEWDNVARWIKEIDPAAELDSGLTNNMSKVISGITTQLEDLDEFQPTITPVLDLTQVQAGAGVLAGMLAANASYLQAATIAKSPPPGGVPGSGVDSSKTAGVNFEQNIYAPQQLSTGDIYRQTRNQIAIAKEELKIP